MSRLFLSPKAEEDLTEIYEYSFYNWGVAQADKYQDELFYGMESILSNNDIGIKYIFKSGDYRSLQINKHLIFYRIDNNNCQVGRILHERMQLSSHFQ